MNKEQQAIASEIQNQLDDGFRNAVIGNNAANDVPMLMFVNSGENRDGVTVSQTQTDVIIAGEAYAKKLLQEYTAYYDLDIQVAINECTRQIDADIMKGLSQGRSWRLAVVDVGAFQWITWNDVEGVVVIDPYTGVLFSVDLEGKRVSTLGTFVVVSQPESKKKKLLIQNVEV